MPYADVDGQGLAPHLTNPVPVHAPNAELLGAPAD
jgi:hypothetical protein